MSAAVAVAPSRRSLRQTEAAARMPLSEYVRSSGLRSLVMGASKNPNAKITILLVAPETAQPVLAVKVPTTDAAGAAVERERQVLAEFNALELAGVQATLPRVVGAAEFEGRDCLVMTAVEGVPMATSYLRWHHTARPARVGADLAAAERWLATFQAATARTAAPIDMDAGVASALRRRFGDEPRLDADLVRLAGIHACLAGHTTPRTAIHGDVWLANLLLTDSRVSGVVDWEDAETSGEPVRDLARFALMYALFLDRRTRPGRRVAGHGGLRAGTWGAGVEFALFGVGWFPTLFRRFLGDGLTRLGAPASLWREAALAGIAEVAALADDSAFARRHLELFRRLAHSGRNGNV